MKNRMCLLSLVAFFCCLSGMSLFGSAVAHAQVTGQDYLQVCESQRNPCKSGLICVTGICVHECNALQAACPQKEPCQIQSTGKGACLCNGHADCPSGTICDRGQCAGNGRLGDLCDTSKPCARGLQCAKPVDATESRCLTICTGTSCNGGLSPCVSSSEIPVDVCYCNQSSHCSVGVCINGTCKQNAGRGEECTQQTTCATGLTCVIEQGAASGRCHPPCTSEKDCFGGEQCITKSGRRVCACDFAFPCRAGNCRAGFCDAYQRCDATNPCTNEQVCFLPIPGRTEGICLKVCTQGTECGGKTACLPLSTSNRKACYCSVDNNCPTSGDVCRNYQCVTGCVSHDDCPLDKICKINLCVTPTAEDPIPERRQEQTTSTDGGTPKPRPEIKPPCDPLCEKPLVCNPTTGKCEQLDLGSFCDKDADCKSGLCFGPAFPKPNICSTTDCSRCPDFSLECQTHGGKKACYQKEIQPLPPTPTKNMCGCQITPQSPPWFWCVLLVVCAFVSTRRKA